MLVPYSRTLYFNDKGRERGLTADARPRVRAATSTRSTEEPATAVDGLPDPDHARPAAAGRCADGLGDIAAGNLTVTPDAPEARRFRRCRGRTAGSRDRGHRRRGGAASRRSTTSAAGRCTCAGRRATTRASTALNERNCQAEASREVTLRLVPDALEDEDMMEMVNAGLIDVLVVDDWKARMWAQILPKIAVHEDVVRARRRRDRLGDPQGQPAAGRRARRTSSPTTSQAAARRIEYRLAQRRSASSGCRTPTAGGLAALRGRRSRCSATYGARYGFDPLMLAAQGYQESRLDQKARSHVGAIGVMQLMPATGAELKVGDITQRRAERPRRRQVHGPADDPLLQGRELQREQPHAVRLRQLQRRARHHRRACARGGQARARSRQVVQQRRAGRGARRSASRPTTYVRNIYKYYVAYKLALEAEQDVRARRGRRCSRPD